MGDFNNLVQAVQSRLIQDDAEPERFVLPAANRAQQLVKGEQRAQDLGGFTRYESKGDGNCTFRSFSQAIVRHQNLHPPFRSGTAALMRLDPVLYNTKKFTRDAYDEYVDDVEQLDSPVGMDVTQATADLLGARVVRTLATTSGMLSEVTPHHGRIYYEINVLNVPEHFDTLGRDHLYPYHLQD